jgi:hypothetical protein
VRIRPSHPMFIGYKTFLAVFQDSNELVVALCELILARATMATRQERHSIWYKSSATFWAFSQLPDLSQLSQYSPTDMRFVTKFALLSAFFACPGVLAVPNAASIGPHTTRAETTTNVANLLLGIEVRPATRQRDSLILMCAQNLKNAVANVKERSLPSTSDASNVARQES